jgi:hypothetical protein
MAAMNATRGAARSFVVRVECHRGRRRYLLHDLRSGEWHRFTLAVHLQRWLRAASRGTLK